MKKNKTNSISNAHTHSLYGTGLKWTQWAFMIKKLMKIFTMIVFKPDKIFKSSKKLEKEIVFLFGFSFIVVFLKSFFVKQPVVTGVFENKIFDTVLYLFSIPQVITVFIYLFFFVFVFVLFLAIKFFSKHALLKPLLFSLMSISSIGIIVHFITIPLFLLSKNVIFLNYIFYIWATFLILLSIKITQDISLIKAACIFLMIFFLFLIFIDTFAAFPYLIYISP